MLNARKAISAACEAGEVAHFAARPDFALAVKMEHKIRLSEQFRCAQNLIADQIFHHAVQVPARVTKRKARERPVAPL